MWKEAVVTYFEVLTQRFPRRREENNEKVCVMAEI
jgi:hypothetical protein